ARASAPVAIAAGRADRDSRRFRRPDHARAELSKRSERLRRLCRTPPSVSGRGMSSRPFPNPAKGPESGRPRPTVRPRGWRPNVEVAGVGGRSSSPIQWPPGVLVHEYLTQNFQFVQYLACAAHHAAERVFGEMDLHLRTS